MPPNPHALGIYLELILVLETTFERFDECKCENDDVHFFSNFFGDGDYCWFKGLINSLLMEQINEYLVHTIH
jgi:hypothetical protein